jgi:hypothetical protein
VARDRKKARKDRQTRRGTELGETDGEPTLIGKESWDELSSRPVISANDQQRHRIQRRAVLGLTLLLVIVLPLGALAMTGVGLGWFEQSFAVQVLAITLTPSFTGWLLVARWAFRSDGHG